MGCKPVSPDYLRKAQIMAYVSFSLAVQVRLRQNSTPKCHWDMGAILSDLIQDCAHGIIRCMGAEHKSLVRFDEE